VLRAALGIWSSALGLFAVLGFMHCQTPNAKPLTPFYFLIGTAGLKTLRTFDVIFGTSARCVVGFPDPSGPALLVDGSFQ